MNIIFSSASFPRYIRHLTLVAAALAVASPATLACSVCGCSLSSDWGLQGYSETPGSQFSVRYEYFDQTNLRSGTGSVNRAVLTFPNGEEIQKSTTNHNLWFGFDHVFDATWAVSLQLPYNDRDHVTTAAGDTALSTSHAKGLGDVRVIARRVLQQDADSNVALQFGLKLPTGRINQNFATGPQAGELLDRGLQLGTGTTDLLLGVSWFARPAASLGVFAQALLDQPLAQRAGFSPSPSVTLNGGLRWLNTSSVTPQLQINVRRDGREHGVNADCDNSGGTVAYLSPGITADVTQNVNAFAFVQLPIYQHVNGLQLEPRWLLSLGLRFKL